jgi:prolyl-tRNA synthetase
MRIRSLFTHTLREAPSQADLTSHKLLTRAGYFQEIGRGAFAVLPLGRRALQQIERSFLQSLGLDSTPVDLPLIDVHEGSLADSNQFTFSDPQGRQLQLVSSFQRAFQDLARQHLVSYKQVPALLHYSGPHWDDEVAPGSGLFYSRLPQVLELAGFFASDTERQDAVKVVSSGIQQFLDSIQIGVLQTSGKPADPQNSLQEWYFLHHAGREQVFSCRVCGYRASQAQTVFTRQTPWQEEPQPLEKVETPDCTTIEDLSQFLGIPRERTAKAVFLTTQREGKEQLIIVIVPGDRELDETRLAGVLRSGNFRPASQEEITATGAVPGYGSPIGTSGAFVVVDEQIPLSSNLVAGANEPGYHYLNVNYGRDYQADLVAEITKPRPGDKCPDCNHPLQAQSAVQIAALETAASEHGIMDPQGKIVPLHVLHCRLHTNRLLAAIAERHHDDYGLIMPLAAAPFPLHLVLLPDKEGAVARQAEISAQNLLDTGLEPLLDDRPERAGVKFNDADLIGIPFRVTISQRGLAEGQIELKVRSGGDVEKLPPEDLIKVIQTKIKETGDENTV